MASLITHPIVPLAFAAVVGRRIVPLPLLLLGMLYSMLPDADGIAFRLGIAYASPFGHRGFSHSIVMALACATLALPLAKGLAARPLATFVFLSMAMLSHGVLDAMTNAGLGVAFYWPFDTQRVFFDFRPIVASPVSVQRFLSARGLTVLQSELVWVWLPASITAIGGWWLRRRLSAARASPARR